MFAWDAKIHPTFTKLVEQFRVEQQNTEVILAQIKSGDKYTINKNQLKKDEAVKQLISDYSFDRLFDYFDRLILVLDS